MKRLIAAGLAVALSVGQVWAQTETAGGASTGAGAATGTAAVAQGTVVAVYAAWAAIVAGIAVSGTTHH